MMQVNPYLNFNGRCAEAFAFYAQLLGGTIVFMQTHGESPAREYATPDWYDKVMHASLKVGNVTLMGSDLPPAHYVQPKGISVSVNVTDLAEAERVFNGLAAGGHVTLALQKTFWSPGFGMVLDRFGIPWMVNCDLPATA